MTALSTPIESAAPQAATTDEFRSAPLVGNPRRTRGLDASMLPRPAPVSAMVGNPRRTRRLHPAVFAAA